MTKRFHAAYIFLITCAFLTSVLFAGAPSATVAHAAQTTQPPTKISIPSIALNAPVIPVGVDSTGEMAVPNGKSNNVGWYEKGPMPGDAGNAVLDAHVFAAFSRLAKIHVGDSIYIKSGTRTLRYITESVETYSLSSLTSSEVFGARGGSTITLVTCAGTFVPAQNTYDHRLVVVASLVS